MSALPAPFGQVVQNITTTPNFTLRPNFYQPVNKNLLGFNFGTENTQINSIEKSAGSYAIADVELANEEMPRPKKHYSLLHDNDFGALEWKYDAADPNSFLASNSSGHSGRTGGQQYMRIGSLADGNCLMHSLSKCLAENYRKSYHYVAGQTLSEAELVAYETDVRETLFDCTILDVDRFPNGIYNITSGNIDKITTQLTKYRCAFVKIQRYELAHKIENNPDVRKFIQMKLSGAVELMGGIDNLISTYAGDLRNLSSNIPPDIIIILSYVINVDIYLLHDTAILQNSNTAKKRTSLFYGGVSVHSGVKGPKRLRVTGDPFMNDAEPLAIILVSVRDVHYDIIGRVATSMCKHGHITYEKVSMETKFLPQEPIIQKLYELLLRDRAQN